MEEMIQIKSLRWYAQATAQQLTQWKQALLSQDSPVLIVVPDPEDSTQYLALLLEKYYTKTLSSCTGVRATQHDTPFVQLTVSGIGVRGFVSMVMRKVRPYVFVEENQGENFTDLLLTAEEENPHKQENANNWDSFGGVDHFLQTQSPASIQRALQEYVIGQQELTRAVAEFLYYHGLRQKHPQLPQRPLMIAGPSGSGKTEVWRVARKLYGDLFPIRIIDGSNLSCDGWAGNYKLDTYVDASLVHGGILVVDEFDKLTKPKHSSKGDNVSLDMQSEFLKLIEGEYRITEKRKQTNLTSQKMGFVLVGAFESLRAEKMGQVQRQTKPIGFCTQTAQPQEAEKLTDEDFIAYGIMPEIVGRIAVKCEAKPLSDSVYADIIRGPNSRVSQLAKVLASYGVAVTDVISNKALMELVAASKSNQTGVRWVSAQVESRLLEAIYEQGLFPSQAAS